MMLNPSRVALFSDVHGNSPALRAVLEDIQDERCAQAFMLGDLINGIDPHCCVRILREWADKNRVELACTKGNAEAYLLTPDRHALAGRPEPWNAEMLRLVDWWEDHLTEEDMDWIRTFHDFIQWKNAILVHDRPIDRLCPESWYNPDVEPRYQEWFYHAPGLWAEMPEDDWEQLWTFMEERHYSQVFCGHSHDPFYRVYRGKQMCNLGSAGNPLNGDPRLTWALANVSPAGEIEITLRQVEYDIALTHQLIDGTPDYPGFETLGFKEAYKKSFSTGSHYRFHLAT